MQPLHVAQVRLQPLPDPLGEISAIEFDRWDRKVADLYVVFSQPGAFWLPTEIRVVASYLGTAALVCSGAIEQVAAQTRLAQNVNLHRRP